LSLEESETKEEQTKKILKTTKDRIQSISLIYTKLYQDTKIREVELKVYMEDLMNQLISLSSNVELDLNIDPVKLELDQMIPLGLILN
jgi:two-component sensor histidine kinase